MPRRNAKFLTEPTIAKLRRPPKGERREVFDSDAPGLALRITDRGVSSWSVYFRLADAIGRTRNLRMTLGSYPALRVAEARRQAREARDQARAGIDPREARRRARSEARATAKRLLFRNVAENYISARCQRKAGGGPKPGHLKRGHEIESVIRRHLIPAWGDRLITEINRLDLRDLTRPLIADDKPMAAHRLHEVAKVLFYWSVNEGLLEASPFARMTAPVDKLPRGRNLKHAELRRLWFACDDIAYPFGPLVKLLVLTLQRRNEVAEMRWAEVDLAQGVWTIPAERSKSKREHIVPLSREAVQVLESLPRYVGGPYVFTTADGRRPVSGFSKMKARLDGKAKIEGWRLHDLRRTGRSEMARLGVDDAVAERVLNHLPRGLVRTYNVYEYAAEKRDALEKWARELRRITSPSQSEVVALSP